MDTGKIYKYVEGNECTIWQMLKRLKELGEWPLNKGKCNGSLNIDHKTDCELMQTGAPVCTCGAENRLR